MERDSEGEGEKEGSGGARHLLGRFLKLLIEQVACGKSTTAALGCHTEGVSQIAHGAGPLLDAITNLCISHGAADTDVHGKKPGETLMRILIV